MQNARKLAVCNGVLACSRGSRKGMHFYRWWHALWTRPVERMCCAVLLARTTEATHQHAEVPDLKQQSDAQPYVQSRCAAAPAKGDKL